MFMAGNTDVRQLPKLGKGDKIGRLLSPQADQVLDEEPGEKWEVLRQSLRAVLHRSFLTIIKAWITTTAKIVRDSCHSEKLHQARTNNM